MAKRASLRDRALTSPDEPRKTDTTVFGAEQLRQEVQEIPVRQIMPNRLQPRTQASSAGLDELAASIQVHGVLEPVLVRSIPLTEYDGTGRRYELVAGERRWRACQLAGRTSIPALILGEGTDDRQMLEVAITENLQREDLHPLDEAMAFGRMQQELAYSHAQIAERLGKSKGYVTNRMRLLTLPPDVQQLVAERPTTLTHVYEIAKVRDEAARAELITAVRDQELSFPETRARVRALLEPDSPSSDAVPLAESVLRKTDPHPDSAPPPEPTLRDAVPLAESVLRKTDQRPDSLPLPNPTLRDAASADDEAPSAVEGAVTPFPLTSRERAVIVTLTEKLTHLQQIDQIAPDDRSILIPLAVALRAVVEQLNL